MLITMLEIVTVVLVLQRVSELILARQNQRKAMARGGKEFGAGHYPAIVVLHVLWMIAFNVEALVNISNGDAEVPTLWWLWALVLGLTQVLRYWAISSLGPLWNTRIIIVPGSRRVVSGPYKYMSHPNYVAVIAEFICVPLMVGAPWTAIGGTLLNLAILLAIRIPAEEKAIRSLEVPEEGLEPPTHGL